MPGDPHLIVFYCVLFDFSRILPCIPCAFFSLFLLDFFFFVILFFPLKLCSCNQERTPASDSAADTKRLEPMGSRPEFHLASAYPWLDLPHALCDLVLLGQ